LFSARLIRHLVLGFAGVYLLAQTPARAQDDEKVKQEAINKRKTFELLDKANEEYRVFFKRPETAIEFWSAIKFEMDLGKFDLAGLHMKLLLEKMPPEDVDKDLVKLEEAEGMSAFLRLKQVRQWSEHPPFQKEATANVELLIERVTKAVEKHLSDPDRIKKYLARLDAETPEERAYAYLQIARSRERAVPYLIEALRVNHGKSLWPRVRETLLRMGPETVPVYLEVFKAANDKDYKDLELRLTLLDLVKERDDKRVIPYLWHMHASKKYPDAVRKRAKEVLASLLRIGIEDVPDAKQTLIYMAERYYQQKVPFPEGKPVQIWPWDGEKIELRPVELSPYRAEEFFGARHAKEALDLDPGYQPAQVVLLSLMLERYYKPKIDQILTEPMPPNMHQLLTTIDADLVIRVLERAMEEKQVPVILPLLQALGERGEARAAHPKPGGQPRGIVQALYYPDRRVQFAAMKAMLNMPPTVRPAVASNRIVELARRFLATDLKSKALVIASPVGEEAKIRDVVNGLGFVDVLVETPAKLFDPKTGALKTEYNSADFDLVILQRGMAEGQFPYVYAKIRQYYDFGGLPMLIVVDKARERTVKNLVASNPDAIVIPTERFKVDEDLKTLVDAQVKKAQLAKLTPAEHKEFKGLSMFTLWRIGKGDLEGYDINPALDVIVEQLKSKEYALVAVEILGRLPGRDIQSRLAKITVGADDPNLRMPAAIELNRHLQQNGVLIDQNQQKELIAAQKQAAEGTPFRAQLNITVSQMTRPNSTRTGADLSNFRPDAAAPKKEK